MCVLRRILDRKQFIGLKKHTGKILNFYKKNMRVGLILCIKQKLSQNAVQSCNISHYCNDASGSRLLNWNDLNLVWLTAF